MKILLLTTHLNKGGIAFYAMNLAKYGRKAGLDISVLSSGGDLEPLLKEEGVPHIGLDIKTKFEFGPKVLRAIPRTAGIVRQGAFDIMHAQTRVTQVIAASVSRLTGTPYITTCHGFFRHERLFRRLLPCWGCKTIAISESVEKHLISDMGVFRDNIEMVYNGIDLQKYITSDVHKAGSLADELGIGPDDIVIGSIGRFSPVKGLGYLIEAFGRISGKRPDIKLLLAGEGPEKEKLVSGALRAGISGRVIVTPCLHDPVKYLGVMDIFCMPSVKEGLGLSMIEAMASGKACIASDVGGLSELISHGKDGILVPPASSRELAEAMIRLVEDRGLRDGLSFNARRKASGFSIEDSVNRTISVYKKALKRGDPENGS